MRCFKCDDAEFLKRGFTIYVRQLLESATEVWNPTAVGLNDAIESVQRRFSKRIFARAKLTQRSYEDRLAFLNWESLEARRTVRDLVFIHASIHRNVEYNYEFAFQCLPLTRALRGAHSLRIRLPFTIPGMRRSSFAARAISIWNSLEEELVTVPETRVFRMRIKRYLDTV